MMLIPILLLFASLLFMGCGEDVPPPVINDSYVDTLVDTLYAGEPSRLVFLSDGVGGYYLDDALRQWKQGEYGLYRFGKRIIADWELTGPQGRMDTNLRFCIAHPEWVERHYRSDLIVRIELPLDMHGFLITITNPTRKEISFRPVFDQQSLTGIKYLTDTPDYRSTWMYSSSRLEVQFSKKRYYTISCPKNSVYTKIDEVRETIYERGQRRGDIEFAHLYYPGDIKVDGEKSVQFAISTGAPLADSILASADIWREQRRRHSIKQFDNFAFICEDKSVERAFAWAKLTLDKLLTADNGNHILLAGLPHSPHGSGWHTALAVKGLARSQSSSVHAYQLLTELLKPADDEEQNPLTKGFFATEIYPDRRSALHSGVEGLSVLALNDIQNYFNDADELYRSNLTRRLGEYLKVASNRYEMGLEFNITDYLGTVRRGGTIEAQFLTAIVRDFVSESDIAGQFPQSFYEGTKWNTFLPGQSVYPPTISGQSGEYRLPLSLSAVKVRYKSRSGQWLDRIKLFSDGYSRQDRLNERIRPEWSDDSTQTVSHILALGWNHNDNVKLNRELLDNAIEVGLIGEAGFRSLAATDPLYQSAHEFYLPDNPQGVMSHGDLLVWTAGRLADMYRSTGQLDSLHSLVDRLNSRVLKSGVIGGLPEAENGEPLPTGDNIIRNPVHSTALAEYIRTVMDNVIGLEWKRSTEVRIESAIPEHWGSVTIEAGKDDERLTIIKHSNTSWSASQHGRDPYLTITMILHPTLDSRVLTSAKIRPGETTQFNLSESGSGWEAQVVSE